MDVFVGKDRGEVARNERGLYLLHRVEQLLKLVGAQDSGSLQFVCMGARTGEIVGRKTEEAGVRTGQIFQRQRGP